MTYESIKKFYTVQMLNIDLSFLLFDILFIWKKCFFRLTPSYLYLIMFVTYLYPYLGNGPYWRGSPEEENCKKNWWTNIIYINNIYPEIQDQVQIILFYFYNLVCHIIIIKLMYKFELIFTFLYAYKSAILNFEFFLKHIGCSGTPSLIYFLLI